MDTHKDLPIEPLQLGPEAPPLYLLIAESIIKLLRNGQLSKSDKLPRIVDIADALSVSRITVRRAMQYLEKNGIVKAKRGRGVIVMKNLARPSMMSLQMPLKVHFDLSAGSHIEMLKSEKVTHCPYEIPPGLRYADSYQRMLRVHSKGNEPYGVIDVYLDLDIYQSSPKKFYRVPVVTGVYELCGADALRKVKQHMTFGRASELVAEHLKIPTGSPIVNARRIVSSPEGIALVVGNTVYPADSLILDIDLIVE